MICDNRKDSFMLAIGISPEFPLTLRIIPLLFNHSIYESSSNSQGICKLCKLCKCLVRFRMNIMYHWI